MLSLRESQSGDCRALMDSEHTLQTHTRKKVCQNNLLKRDCFATQKMIASSLTSLPDDSIQSVLSHTSAATCIRCALTSKSLLTAAMAVARKRASRIDTDIHDQADTLPWEECETRPLAVVFKKELTDLLIRLDALPRSSGWQDTGEFLWFRLKEEDLNNEFGDEEAGMLVFDGSEIEWLHFRIDGAQEAYSEKDDVDMYAGLYGIGLEVHKTVWQRRYDDHLVFTANLPLHERWGRNVVSIEDFALLRTLHTWKPSEDEKASFDADVRQGVDAAILLSRFSGMYSYDVLQYRGQGKRPMSWEVEHWLSIVAPPEWQQRPSPFCRLTQSHFGRALFDYMEHVLDPHGGPGSYVAWHNGVGNEVGCWFRYSLAFFDAIEKLSTA